ncbi:MAG: hypothetical protein KC635_20930, partial [Myxococcales bacterium]|nr:hypothetical protein [Myxococcales bacterium]
MTLRELRASTRALFIVAAAAIGTAALSAPQEARAADDGEFLLTLDGALAFPVSDPFDSAYNIGFYGGLGAYWAPKGMWSMGARLHAGMLGGDDGFGTDNLGYGLLTAAIRLRPLGNHGYSRGDGFWVEIGAGVGMMDDLLGDGVDVQPAFEASMGYHVQSGTIDVGPYIGVTHILRAEDEGTGLGGEDLIVMQFGVSIGFFDSRKPAAEPEPEPEPPVVVTPPPTEPVRPKRPDNFSVDETVFFDYNKS